MVFGNISDSLAAVLRQEVNHFGAVAPAGMIHPKINRHFSAVAQNFQHHCQKTIGVAFGLSEHHMTALDGIHPAKNIQPLLMLSSRQDNRLRSLLGPQPAKTRVQATAELVGDTQHPLALSPLNHQEFFIVWRNSSTPSIVAWT